VGTDFNYVRNELTENIRLQQVGFFDPNLGFATPTGDPLLRQTLQIPQCHFDDPGIFVDATLPLNKRLTLNAGARADSVFTTSHDRLVTGNVIVTPGIQNNPLVAGQIAPGTAGVGGMAGNLMPAPGLTSFDPILFSTKPFVTDGLSRHFDTRAAYVTGDYKI